MARRETVKRTVQCPNCDVSGTVVWEENETPPHHGGRFDERFDSIPPVFKQQGNDLFCRNCDTKVFGFDSE